MPSKTEYRLILCGPQGSGKTTLCMQFTGRKPSEQYNPSLSEHPDVFYLSADDPHDEKMALIRVVDFGGNEGFQDRVEAYLRDFPDAHCIHVLNPEKLNGDYITWVDGLRGRSITGSRQVTAMVWNHFAGSHPPDDGMFGPVQELGWPSYSVRARSGEGISECLCDMWALFGEVDSTRTAMDTGRDAFPACDMKDRRMSCNGLVGHFFRWAMLGVGSGFSRVIETLSPTLLVR